MKYYFQFEGKENILVQLILLFSFISMIFLGILSFTDRPIRFECPLEFIEEIIDKT